MRRLLRILLKTLKWTGLSLSTLLLAGTVFCWVRSLGHVEGWQFERFTPRPDWTFPVLGETGIERWLNAEASHRRFWLGSGSAAPRPESEPRTRYRRDPLSADEAEAQFNDNFEPGERLWSGGTERAWRLAGAGFCRRRGDVDHEIGRPNIESFHLAIPFWMLAVVFGLWPVCFVARRVFRRRRHGAGRCPQCGYDLRATPDRCPECGRAIVQQASR